MNLKTSHYINEQGVEKTRQDYNKLFERGILTDIDDLHFLFTENKKMLIEQQNTLDTLEPWKKLLTQKIRNSYGEQKEIHYEKRKKVSKLISKIRTERNKLSRTTKQIRNILESGDNT